MNSRANVGDDISELPPGPRLGLGALLVLAGFVGLMIAATDSAAETGPYTTTHPTTTTASSTTTTQPTATTATSTSTTSTSTTSTTSTTTTQPTATTVSCYAKECVGSGKGFTRRWLRPERRVNRISFLASVWRPDRC